MKKRLWIASILAGLSVTAAIGGVSVVNEQPFVTASAETWTVASMDKKYLYGTTFSAPEAKVEVNGKEATATASVTYPNGLVTTAENVELNQEGTYTVTYRAVADGVHCVEEKYFFVEAKAYLTQKEESSVEYGTYTGHGANTKGLIVRLAKGDTLTFSQLIDFSKLSPTTPLGEWFATPDSVGALDFAALTFTFTDAVDPSHYISFKTTPYDARDRGVNTSYTTVAGDGQSFKGLDGSAYNSRGSSGTHSFVAQRHENDGWTGPLETLAPGKFVMRMFYDTKTMEAFTSNWNGSPKHIAYLNDLSVFESVWQGLPSGQARLTVTADDYMSKTANFVIKSVYCIDDLSATRFDEKGAPELSIAMSQDEMPTGEVGRAYKVPEVTAFDYYSGDCVVSTKIYRDYASANPISVGLVNGAFTPTVAGWYTVEYSSVDMLGNEVYETRSVYVSDDLGDITIAMPTLPSEVDLGTFVSTPVATYAGDCGLASLKITASLGDETIELKDGFIPEKEGDWKITYTVTDYVGRVGTAEHVVTAKKTNVAQLMGAIVLPKVFLSDSAYVLPQIYAKDYSTGVMETKPCTVVVTDKNGDKTYKPGDTFTPSVVVNGDKVKVSYQYNGQVLQEKEVPTILAVEKAKVSGRNYLYGTGFTSSFKDAEGNFLDDGIMVTADAESASCGWMFATKQLFEDLLIEFQGDKARTTFGALKITLVDVTDDDVKVSLTITAKETGATITTGESSAEASTSIVTDGSYKVAYKNGRFYFNDVNIKAETTEDGEAFEGFNSEFVYVYVDMLEAQEGSSYKLLSMARSNLSRRNLEVFKPIIQTKGDLKGERGINEILEVYSAVAHDTFAPLSELTVTVMKPDGSIATDVDGVKLEKVSPDRSYFVQLSHYGNYKVVYDTVETDWVGENKFSLVNTIFVIDAIRPQAVFLNATQTTAKVGDTLVMPDVAVRDNVSAVENISITRGVLCPNGKYWRFASNKNAIKCTQEGDYVFSAYVYDERGNYTVIKHTITVTK